MPLYYFLFGAGIGKSRHAAEFHKISVHCLGDEDEDLMAKLCNAWIFHNTCEMLPHKNKSVWAREQMLYRLLPKEKLQNIIETYEAPDPWSVLELVAKHEEKELKDTTVILIVDGLHALMVSENNGQDKSSVFYKTLTAIGDLTHEEASYFLVVRQPSLVQLGAAYELPIGNVSISQLLPCFRTKGVLRPVLGPTDTISQILLEDCGGHGRAIELL